MTGEPMEGTTPPEPSNNPWLSALLIVALGAFSLGIVLVMAGASPRASTIGGGLVWFGALATIGYLTARAVIWNQDQPT